MLDEGGGISTTRSGIRKVLARIRTRIVLYLIEKYSLMMMILVPNKVDGRHYSVAEGDGAAA